MGKYGRSKGGPPQAGRKMDQGGSRTASRKPSRDIRSGVIALGLGFEITVAYSHWSSDTHSSSAHSFSFFDRAMASDNISPENIPPTLADWRINVTDNDNEGIWRKFRDHLRDAGATLWPHKGISILKRKPRKYVRPNGYAYVTPFRGLDGYAPGTAMDLTNFQYKNELQRPATLQDGRDGIVRVVVLRDEGHTHLKILRKIANEPLALLTNNHTLPLLFEMNFDLVTFCVFPLVGGGHLRRAFADMYESTSVGDLLDMVMQALEGLAFIHDLHIAHRDAFVDNFLVEWQPESLHMMKVPTARPRVYLIDFETAVMFELGCDLSECTCTGIPLGDLENYSRPVIPEMLNGQPYDPFKLDVWQLGVSLVFDTTLPPIEHILESMHITDAHERPYASEALLQLSRVVNNMTPQSLLIPSVPFLATDDD
ncbi:hypothetical protein EVG20_g1274 [Dentipellis fragilis]|uniref:Protein kinase domain-containing protein n=1 Tax=Dentipellis fragilis TaxID=205917 RepID=A0A4Y9ZB98_9AGAM|nr:hypothetical protein EVG20_g1274 [Dentipellis fragilis]